MNFIIQDTDLDTKSGLSILYFYAPWLLFHNKIINDISELENTYNKIKFYGIDVIQFKKLIVRFNISSIPSLLITKDEGKFVKNIIGVQAISNTKSTIHDIYKAYVEGT